MKYRLVCSLGPNWNKAPANRYGMAEAKRLKEAFDKTCPGRHVVEPINE